MSLPESNQRMIMDGVRLILKGLGEDPERPGIKDTPLRVAKLYSDILDGRFAEMPDLTSFEEDYHGIIMVHHVPFYGFCEHHLLPFYGHFGIGYKPNDNSQFVNEPLGTSLGHSQAVETQPSKVLGLSKLVRLFRQPCKKIGTQERITKEAVDLLNKEVKPAGAICYVTAEHTCMSLRGVKSPGAMTTTWEYTGVFESDAELRTMFMAEASARR